MSVLYDNILWKKLSAARKNNQLTHALLFESAASAEQFNFAKEFAQEFAIAMLCEKAHSSPKNIPCGICHSCCLMRADSHPDFIAIQPEGAEAIKIAQIRGIIHQVQETHLQGGWQVIIISPAHAMNIAAANALLKTLEEPPSQTLFILISDQIDRLPLTIRSRCQKWVFPRVGNGSNFYLSDELTQSLSEGLIALSQQKADPLQMAVMYQEKNLTALFEALFYHLHHYLQVKLIQHTGDVFVDLSTEKLLDYINFLQIRYQQVRSSNLNQQLLLEELFIRWAGYFYVFC